MYYPRERQKWTNYFYQIAEDRRDKKAAPVSEGRFAFSEFDF
jgi:hypothetical protein